MDQAGFQEGDIITAINEQTLTDAATVDLVFDQLEQGQTLTMQTLMGPVRRVSVSGTDPVPLGIVQALETQDCRDAQLEVADPNQQTQIQPYFYSANKRFRCDDAHIALQALGQRYEIDQVYILRGSRRIIIAMPYWGTACIAASAVDGDALSDENLLSVIDQVIGGYVADRHANP